MMFGLAFGGRVALAQDPSPALQVPAASDTTGGVLKPIALPEVCLTL